MQKQAKHIPSKRLVEAAGSKALLNPTEVQHLESCEACLDNFVNLIKEANRTDVENKPAR